MIPAPSMATTMCGDSRDTDACNGSRKLHLLDLKKRRPHQNVRIISAAGDDFACVTVQLNCRDTVLDMQLASAAIVVKPIRDVGGLLCLDQNHAAANGVYGSRGNV